MAFVAVLFAVVLPTSHAMASAATWTRSEFASQSVITPSSLISTKSIGKKSWTVSGACTYFKLKIRTKQTGKCTVRVVISATKSVPRISMQRVFRIVTPPATTTTAVGSTSLVLTPGYTKSFTIKVANVSRTYSVFAPHGLPATGEIPMLLGLHGASGSALQFEASSNFDAIASRQKFIVVYPDGLFQTWNAGGCCGGAQISNVDDVGFISAVIDVMTTSYRADKNRTYVAGYSNGGMMAYRLACELSTKVVAVALQAGSLMTQSCTPSVPVPLLHIHGNADDVVAINGGSFLGYTFPAARTSLDTYVRASGCHATPTTKSYPGKSGVTIFEWSGCQGIAQVKYEIVDGASHSWMGNTQDPNASMKLNASEEIWSFVSQFSR